MAKKKQSKGTKDDPKKKLRARVARAPQKPGVYKWLSKSGEILYIGKAKNIKNRLKSYVQKEPDLSLGPWKLALIKNIVDIDCTVTDTELEALILETNLIKEHKPKYNVMMKDDKNYVYVKITIHDDYPEISIERRMEKDKAKYFGPFTSARNTRRTLELLHDVFGFRACTRSIQILSRDPMAETKPCIEYQIGKCNGLCAGELTQDEYKRRTEEVIWFFKGEHGNVIEKLKEMLQQAADARKFEKAATLRDTLTYIESLKEQQIVSDTSRANTDYIGTALQHDRAHVVILREREGKLIGELSYALKGNADTTAEVLGQFLPQYYSEMTDLPEIVICGEDFEEKDVLEEWLCRSREKKVTIDVPERGKKSKLLKMAEKNAKEKVQQQLAKWEAEAQKIESALQELKDVLKLKDIPKRIECYDISHHSGTETVGSMVVFVNGKAKNEHYRSFTIRTMQEGEIDDYKALKEILQRRLRYLSETQNQEEERWKNEGISIGKARKVDQKRIEEIHKENEKTMSQKNIAYQDYFVARHEEEIIGFGRITTNDKKITEMKSLWVHEEYRGGKLGHAIIKQLLHRLKTGKVYITTDSSLEEYYAHLGFRHVITPPAFLTEQMEWITKNKPTLPHGLIMMYEAVKNKPDASFTSKPDLLVLDGGKGQLSCGTEVLESLGVTIPITALAKQEEDVFVPGNSTPLPFEQDSEAHFLLMRLRDEAHRFANRHRERRAKHALTSS